MPIAGLSGFRREIRRAFLLSRLEAAQKRFHSLQSDSRKSGDAPLPPHQFHFVRAAP